MRLLFFFDYNLLVITILKILSTRCYLWNGPSIKTTWKNQKNSFSSLSISLSWNVERVKGAFWKLFLHGSLWKFFSVFLQAQSLFKLRSAKLLLRFDPIDFKIAYMKDLWGNIKNIRDISEIKKKKKNLLEFFFRNFSLKKENFQRKYQRKYFCIHTIYNIYWFFVSYQRNRWLPQVYINSEGENESHWESWKINHLVMVATKVEIVHNEIKLKLA